MSQYNKEYSDIEITAELEESPAGAETPDHVIRLAPFPCWLTADEAYVIATPGTSAGPGTGNPGPPGHCGVRLSAAS